MYIFSIFIDANLVSINNKYSESVMIDITDFTDIKFFVDIFFITVAIFHN